MGILKNTTMSLANLLHRVDRSAILELIENGAVVEPMSLGTFMNKVQPKDKAEFCCGLGIWHSPVMRPHTNVGTRLFHVLQSVIKQVSINADRTQVVAQIGYEKAMIQVADKFYAEPDLMYYRYERAMQLDEIMEKSGQKIWPIPDWIMEILSPGTEKWDRNEKSSRYAAAGVEEYWLVDPKNETIEQFVLIPNTSTYRLQGIFSIESMIQSVVFEDFEIPVEVIFDEDAYEFFLEEYILLTTENKAKLQSEGIEIGIEIGETRGIEKGKEIGIEIGETRGIEKGKEIGIEIGEVKGVQKAAQVLKLYFTDKTPEAIADLTGYTLEEVKKIIAFVNPSFSNPE